MWRCCDPLTSAFSFHCIYFSLFPFFISTALSWYSVLRAWGCNFRAPRCNLSAWIINRKVAKTVKSVNDTLLVSAVFRISMPLSPRASSHFVKILLIRGTRNSSEPEDTGPLDSALIFAFSSLILDLDLFFITDSVFGFAFPYWFWIWIWIFF